jgi:hypothetical protein
MALPIRCRFPDPFPARKSHPEAITKCPALRIQPEDLLHEA